MLRAMLVLGLAAALLLAACGGPEAVAPAPSPAPIAAPTPTPPSTSTSADTSSEVSVVESIPAPEFYYAGSPSLEERIYKSDAVVRATLISTGNSPLRFKVLEYLKGSGASEITVNANPALRNTSYDKREAILFLSQPSSGASGKSGSSNGTFTFTTAHYNAPGYTIDTLDPAWLPAETPVTSGASDNVGSASFITDSGAASKMSKETVSLADLKTKIAWMGGGKNVSGYDFCISRVINYWKFYRDYQAYYGKARAISNADASVLSGAGAGTVVKDYGPYHEPGYGRIWLTGADSALFTASIVDSNTTASDGHTERIATARPLPAGAYKFRDHGILYHYLPCNFTPTAGTGQLDWTVTVTAPVGTVHEAFFDPVSVGGAVKADAEHGVLKPTAFTGASGPPAALRSISYEAGAVTMAVSPVGAVAGLVVEFIGMDGTVSLSLAVADATVDGGGGTLRWPASPAPWASGDTLMVRVRAAV